METVAGAMVVTTLCVAAGFVTLRGAGAAAEVMTQMFSAPADLGWPSGVQEDDDFHWRWSGRPAVPGENAVDDTWPLPEIVDLMDGTGPRPLPVARH
jgi:hypothetical protein